MDSAKKGEWDHAASDIQKYWPVISTAKAVLDKHSPTFDLGDCSTMPGTVEQKSLELQNVKDLLEKEFRNVNTVISPLVGMYVVRKQAATQMAAAQEIAVAQEGSAHAESDA